MTEEGSTISRSLRSVECTPADDGLQTAMSTAIGTNAEPALVGEKPSTPCR